jgi:hypothetical protein
MGAFQQPATIVSQKYLGIILYTTLPLPGGGLSEPQFRYRGGLNAPIILIVITGQAQRSMLVGELNLMGLPGETMRRTVPSKWLLINLIAAWETASRQGGGVAVLFVKELLGHDTSATVLCEIMRLCNRLL